MNPSCGIAEVAGESPGVGDHDLALGQSVRSQPLRPSDFQLANQVRPLWKGVTSTPEQLGKLVASLGSDADSCLEPGFPGSETLIVL